MCSSNYHYAIDNVPYIAKYMYLNVMLIHFVLLKLHSIIIENLKKIEINTRKMKRNSRKKNSHGTQCEHMDIITM